MKPRRLWILAAAFLALSACQTSTSTEGTLSNGAFSYVCAGAPDNACDGIEGDMAAVPDRIAVGLPFTLAYQVSPGLNLDAQAPESTSPTILGGADGSFQFVRAGTAGVIVRGGGGILDFTSVTGADLAGIGAFDEDPAMGCSQLLQPPPDGGVPDGGAGPPGPAGAQVLAPVSVIVTDSLDLSLEPVDSGGEKLAGPASIQVTSSDSTIVSVAPSPFGGAHAFELCGQATGTVVITVAMGQTVAAFLATVVDQP